MNTLGISREGQADRYLGLPVHVGRSKTRTFAYIKDGIWRLTQGWKERVLSKMGKEILVKACAQAIPIFAMMCFDLTKGFCEQLNVMISRFWWAQQQNEAKVHWLGWEKLTRAKQDRGLGYKDLHLFNLSMLAKQGWRFLTDPDTLCARVLKARYFPEVDVLHAEPKWGISYTWRSILRGITVLKEGLIKRIGNGEETNIWIDPWLPRNGCTRPITPKGQTILQKVSELINPVMGSWDEELVRDTFWPIDATVVLAIPLYEGFEDQWAWHYERKVCSQLSQRIICNVK